jgi:hypothetical protein
MIRNYHIKTPEKNLSLLDTQNSLKNSMLLCNEEECLKFRDCGLSLQRIVQCILQEHM